jgi:phospholipid/cholesterol/gamma-HCH transport system substrate-binding protein
VPVGAAIDEAEAEIMETRANYALIGAFTLATIAAAFLFVFWFSGNQNPAGLKSYRVVFTSSVSGLSRGSSVLFNGLRVGEVTTINLGEDPSQVYAMIDIDRRTPVKTDTTARLEYQGLTGVAAVALSGGSAASAPLEANAQGGPPQILAERSDYQNIVESLQALSGKADSVLQDVDHLLADNSKGISQTVQNVAKFSQAMADNSDKLGDTIAQLDRVTATLDANRGNIDSIMTDGRALTAQLNESATKIDGLLDSVKGLVDQPGSKGMFNEMAQAAQSIRKLADNLDRFTGTGLQKYEALATNGQKTLNDIDNAVRSLQKNPQQVIFGAKPALPEYNGGR